MIGDEKFRNPDPGSGIKHPGSATLGGIKHLLEHFSLKKKTSN
jgi:hypothetical protein